MTLYMYIRLSLADEDVKYKLESDSIANQRALLHQHVKMHPEFRGWTIEEFVDDGFSGTNGNRPAFERMIRQLKLGGASVVLCKDLSRFFRDYAEIGDYLERVFPSLGVRLIAVNDGYDSNDYIGTTGGMDVVLKCIVYAYYSRDLSQKTRSALESRAKAGKHIGQVPPYGYQKDPQDKSHLVPEPESAKNVKRIFAMAKSGMTTTAIARRMNEEHVPTPAEHHTMLFPNDKRFKSTTKSVSWTDATIRQILSRLVYTGAIVSQTKNWKNLSNPSTTSRAREDWIVVPDCHEALVSEEDFQHVQKAIARRSMPIKVQGDYLLRTLVVCGECGRKMQTICGQGSSR